ncbi:hypothetical protein ACHQM5_023623 [Ranunculus cassubicifolius]
MCPYRNVRYWMSDYKKADPRNKEEKFNRAHAQLRNVIEKTFGVLKGRFPILTRMPSYSFQTQVHIVVACMTIHNYIRTFSVDDELFRRNEHGEENENDGDNDDEPAIHADQVEAPPRYSEIFGSNSQRHMIDLRDQIAEQLWSGNY